MRHGQVKGLSKTPLKGLGWHFSTAPQSPS